jgi:DNA-binding response OmpR family regulator
MAKILLVDDDESELLFVRLELEEEGYKVITATNGRDALEKVKIEEIDLVVLDIQMPDIDGIEALSKILTIDKTIPVILHTAYSSFKDNFMTWTADDYVIKSSDLTELKNKIKELLVKKRGIKI